MFGGQVMCLLVGSGKNATRRHMTCPPNIILDIKDAGVATIRVSRPKLYYMKVNQLNSFTSG